MLLPGRWSPPQQTRVMGILSWSWCQVRQQNSGRIRHTVQVSHSSPSSIINQDRPQRPQHPQHLQKRCTQLLTALVQVPLKSLLLSSHQILSQKTSSVHSSLRHHLQLQ